MDEPHELFMHYLIKLHPEITIKSKSVRDHMIKCLRHNVRMVIQLDDPQARVQGGFDSLEVHLSETLAAAGRDRVEAALGRIPGLHEILAVEEFRGESPEQIARQVLPYWVDQVAGKRFCVRVKRRGDHAFTSSELERYLGAQVLAAVPDATVDLTRPEVTLTLELKNTRLLLITRRWPGVGGYPLGTQENALALISGGFDSPVAAWRMMTRGARTHFLFFNLGGPAHEAGVREVVLHLWRQYGRSHKVFFTSVPFEPVVAEILRVIPDGLMGVVLKRMMLRVASRFAEHWQIPALVTGDAVAQVSSQSLTNLKVIDQVTDQLVLRPVITENKQTIIDEARRIGTAPYAESMPEYCGVISRRPNIRVRRADIETAEVPFDFSVLENAREQAVSTRIDRLEKAPPLVSGELLTLDMEQAQARPGPVRIVDIRPEHERSAAPLQSAGLPVDVIPFYELQSRVDELAADTTWLLYCDRGVMSRMQALHLADQGVVSVGVLVLDTGI